MMVRCLGLAGRETTAKWFGARALSSGAGRERTAKWFGARALSLGAVVVVDAGYGRSHL
ncbi:hypothetical protein JB92DRAFT_3035044, partial [Gautieria morchelliformis]